MFGYTAENKVLNVVAGTNGKESLCHYCILSKSRFLKTKLRLFKGTVLKAKIGRITKGQILRIEYMVCLCWNEDVDSWFL